MITFTTNTTPFFKTLFDSTNANDFGFSSIAKDYYLVRNDDGYEFEHSIPGLIKEDLAIKIIKGRLSIKSEKTNYWISAFDKTFSIPEDVNVKKIKAAVENGILLIKMPINKEFESIIEII